MPRPRSDIEPRIVEAARARFLADGVDGASLREIAREAGTNIGMIVYYFPSKDDLFLAVIEETYAVVLRDLESALAPDAPASQRLRRALIRLGNASDREFEVIRLVAREALLSSSRFKRIVARFMRGHVPLVAAALADGVRDGELDPSVPPALMLIAVVGLGALPQLLRRATRGIGPLASLPGPEKLADASLALLLRAIGRTDHEPPLPSRRSRRSGRSRGGRPRRLARSVVRRKT